MIERIPAEGLKQAKFYNDLLLAIEDEETEQELPHH